jgi:hypothetical protein
MCEECWEKWGSPQIDNPQVRHAVAMIADLYREHLVGGHLHIVVDDWNLEDGYLAFCAQDAHDRSGGYDPEEQACADALTACTEVERASALALGEGFWQLHDR